MSHTCAEGSDRGARRVGFGPLEQRRPSFTLSRRSRPRYLGFDRVADARPPHPSVLPAFRPSAELVPPTMPSADFCAAIKSPCGDFSLVAETQRRPPEVRPTAFAARPPDLPPRPLMTMDFAIIGSLVRPGRPRIRFLSIGPRFCSTLPSDPASRRRPCASLALLRHPDGQRTFTSKLSNMLGAHAKRPGAGPGLKGV